MIHFQKRSFCLFRDLLRRNIINKTYPDSLEAHDDLKNALSTKCTVYAGFDATSDSLHLGNLTVLISLIHFQRNGHKIICLIGDATTKIGDPSGRTIDRDVISQKNIEENSSSIETNIKKILSNAQTYFGDTTNLETPVILRNSSWYKDAPVIDFTSEVFREIRVGSMLHRKSIQDRLATPQGMSMSEFCYQIFQAYDWYHLYKNYDCNIQIGGSDQAGNIYTGHNFIKKYYSKKAIGILTPLILNSYGKKLGKSIEGKKSKAWLDPSKTSSYDLYQHILKTTDVNVEMYLKIFSFKPIEEIEDLVKNKLRMKEDFFYCQRILARDICLLVHGQEGLNQALNLTHQKYPPKSS